MAEPATESEIDRAFLETLVGSALIGFALVDRALRYVRVNDALAAINRLPAASFIGRTVREMVPRLWPELEPMYRRALAGETVVNQEINDGASASAGQTRYWQVSYHPVPLRGEIVGVGVIVSEITERRRAEEGLLIRNNLYAMLSRTNQAVSRCRSSDELFDEVCAIAVEVGRFRFAWVGVPDGSSVRLVASAGDDRGYMAEAVITLDDGDPRSHGPTGRAATTGQSYVVNDFMASPMTAPWHEPARRAGIAASATFPIKERDAVVAVLTIYAEVPGFFSEDMVATLSEMAPSLSFALDRFAQERERRRDEAELRLRDRTIQAVSQGIVITDACRPDNPITFVSSGFERLTGYRADEIVGQNCRFLQGKDSDPATVTQLREAILRGQGCTVELLNYRKDGSAFWNNLTISAVHSPLGHVTHFVGVQTDVTERRRLEEQLRQSQKMEAFGQLAGGVAHDFNNMLTIITGYSDLLLESTPPDDAAWPLLEEIRKAGERSAALTRQLLAFSRKQVLAPKVLDLNDVIRDTEKMLRRLIGEDIQLSTALHPRLGHVKADPGQLEQVLLNLVINARDAMPDGGRLTIETDNIELGDAYARSHAGVRPGHYAMIAMADTGVGMSDEVKQHIFEPFFTTKERGKGTGLGLAVVHGVVAQSEGAIDVESAVGVGTSLKIYLPHVEQGEPPCGARPGRGPAQGGSETILLVEDEEGVRAFARFALRDRGYTVLEARSGEEALRVAANRPEPIHLLVTDVVMPDINGRALAERLLALRPKMRVLYMSGHTDDAVMRHGILHEEVHFLQKPFSPTALAHKVRDVFNRR